MPNNLEDLTNKLRHLAEHHACQLTDPYEKNNSTSDRQFTIKEIANSVTSQDYFRAVDKDIVSQEITRLETSLNDLLDVNSLTRSRHINKQMPVAFDALVEIFASSNEEFRQQYFQQLSRIYYEDLYRNLRNLENEKSLDRTSFNQQVKVLLPVVKLRLAYQWLQENTPISGIDREELLSNIALYFKFPIINQEDIYEVIRNKIGSSNFDLHSYELIPLDEKNGHLGEYFKLKIKLTMDKNLQQLDLFAKSMTPKTEGMKKMVASGPSKKEEFFYMTYIPLLEKYGLKSLISAPMCYFSRLNDIVILDDMAVKGFVGVTPNVHLKYGALQKVVQRMASFHSATMILEEILSQKKEKRVTVYDLYAEFLQEVFFVPSDDFFMKPDFDTGLEAMHYIASKFPEVTKNFTEEDLKDKINKGWYLHFKKLTKSDNLKNSICHGDMHVSNMLFKYDKDKVCQDVRLIDFQILRYCPPTHDLVFFLQQSCTKEKRDKYLPPLSNEYYKELSKNMENFGFDINKVYPKEDFENSLRYMKSQALFQALYYSPITSLSPKVREDIFLNEEQADYYMHKYRWKLVDLGLHDDTYKTVLKGLMEDLVELCENGDL